MDSLGAGRNEGQPCPRSEITMAHGPLPVVLCVDDEPQILAGLSVNLRRRYDILTATSGDEALALLTARPGIAVVMSDMRMPGMDGATFLAKAKQLAPDT